MFSYYIYKYKLPLEILIQVPKISEQLTDSPADLFPDNVKLSVDLNSSHPVLSLFQNADFYNKVLKVVDEEYNRTVWTGNIKRVDINRFKGIIEVEANTIIRDFTKNLCVYENTERDETPAEIIKKIITNSVMNGQSLIDEVSFNNIISYEKANNFYLTVNYTAEDNIDVATVITEICRVTQKSISTPNNIVRLNMWKSYSGTKYLDVNSRYIITEKFKESFSDKNLYNSVRLLYRAEQGLLGIHEDSLLESIEKYNIKKYFSLPSDAKIEDLNPVNHKMYFSDLNSVRFAGSLALSRYKNIEKTIEVSFTRDLNFLFPSDHIDLSMGTNYKNEPLKIIKKTLDEKKGKIDVTLKSVNFLDQYVIRDRISPEKPVIKLFYLTDEKVEISWIPGTDGDLKGYKIYYSYDSYNWNIHTSKGDSPVSVNKENIIIKENLYTFTIDKPDRKNLFVKIKAIDNSFNESQFSDIFYLCLVPEGLKQFYACIGDCFINDLKLDLANTIEGVPDEFTYYDQDVYDNLKYGYTGIFVSEKLSHPSGFKKIVFESQGDIQLFFTDQTGNKTVRKIISLKPIDLPSLTEFQFKILFLNPRPYINLNDYCRVIKLI